MGRRAVLVVSILTFRVRIPLKSFQDKVTKKRPGSAHIKKSFYQSGVLQPAHRALASGIRIVDH